MPLPCLLVALLFSIGINYAFAGVASTTDDTSRIRWYDHIQLLSEHAYTADLGLYFFQNSAFKKERYFVGATTGISLAFFSINNLYSFGDFYYRFGMGQTPNNVVFDPMDIDFNLTSRWEYRFKNLRLKSGVDHACFHEIDRKGLPTTYWNKFFVAATSHNAHPAQFWHQLNQVTQEPHWSDKLSYSIGAGWFLREFFGLVSPGKLNGYNNRRMELEFESRYAFYRRRSWIVNGHFKTLLGVSRAEGDANRDPYWSQTLAVEATTRRGDGAGMVFAEFTLDQMPPVEGPNRFSRDQLLRVGLRVAR